MEERRSRQRRTNMSQTNTEGGLFILLTKAHHSFVRDQVALKLFHVHHNFDVIYSRNFYIKIFLWVFHSFFILYSTHPPTFYSLTIFYIVLVVCMQKITMSSTYKEQEPHTWRNVRDWEIFGRSLGAIIVLVFVDDSEHRWYVVARQSFHS